MILAAAGLHGLLLLLIYVLVGLLILGVIWYVANLVTAELGLPRLVPLILLLVVLVIFLIWLADVTA